MSHELDVQVAELLKMRWKDEDLFIETYRGQLQISYVYRHRNDVREFSPSTQIEDAIELVKILLKTGKSWKLQIDEKFVLLSSAWLDLCFSKAHRTNGIPEAITKAFIAAKEAT